MHFRPLDTEGNADARTEEIAKALVKKIPNLNPGDYSVFYQEIAQTYWIIDVALFMLCSVRTVLSAVVSGKVFIPLWLRLQSVFSLMLSDSVKGFWLTTLSSLDWSKLA